MIQNTNVNQQNIVQQYVYPDFNTRNQSFLDIHNFLKDVGIQNNSFFLITLDPDLIGVDPRDPRLNRFMKQKILVECMRNYWYFIREVVRVPDSGGTVSGGIPYKLHRGNLALNYCLIYNYNVFIELPRQHGKTISICIRILWEFLFGTSNSEMMFINKKHQDAKDNLQRLKDLRNALPEYLQMSERYDSNGKKIKARDSIETLSNPSNNNKIKTMPGARNKVNAMSLGRGCTQPRQWYDEFAFIIYNDIIYQSATPAYKTASRNAKRNNAPYGIIMSTTPGDMTTDQGLHAFNVKENATNFSEQWYDFDKAKLDELLEKNEKSTFVYIRFTYQQLGSTEEYFKEMVKDLEQKWDVIRREVLLEWSSASDNCPFKKEDLNRIKLYIKEPIQTIHLLGFYQFNIYEKFLPDPKHIPIIGVDVAGGYQQDSSAITIIDSYDTRVKADMNCNYISIADLIKVIYVLVNQYFPNAVVNVERNGGFGASVVSSLVKSNIKHNLYYEIKDKAVEESFNGSRLVRRKQRTRVYGLDSTKNVRELLIDLLNERVLYHKDKFISPIIYKQLETLEVKKNGKVEHSSNGHDDQIFSYLMALYVWYYGKDVMERWNVYKHTIRTDEDLEDGVIPIEEKYESVMDKVNTDAYERNQVQEQIDFLNKGMGISFEEHLLRQQAEDDKALERLIMTNPLAKAAYAKKYANEVNTLNPSGMYTLDDSIYKNFNESYVNQYDNFTDNII